MATRYTTNKAPGMAVTLSRDGVYIEIEGDMIKVSTDKPENIEQAVLVQFHAFDEGIVWEDIEIADLHDQYNNS
jgi:hypothetical protein